MLKRLAYCLVSSALLVSSVWGQNEQDPNTELAQALPRLAPKEPEDALSSIRILAGFRLELLAAEPLVADPVAMQYDENGLAYVVEMRDYPFTDRSLDASWQEQTSPPLGRVRILEDADGDGRFDKSTVFAEELSWPTGLVFWKGGVFVTATPDVWYLKDTDGDRRADVRRKVFTGFRKFNVQAVMNNLKWGLDHLVYGAGSSNSGDIRPGDDPQAAPIVLGRNDFRFDPRTEELERIPGGARFGNAFDDWGNRFICNIRNPIRHIVLENRYLARNPYLSVPSAIHDAADFGDAIPVFRTSPPEPWRVINARRLASNTARKSPRSEMAATGFVTSCSGITIYRGAAYPKSFDGDVFIGEVAGNLVMRQRLSAVGPTFNAARVHQQEEFISSSDNWFRPVNFVNAPDGTLHLLDMYRETIEHPWSIPEDIKAHVDLTSGRDRGRIYRLVPPRTRPGFQPPPKPQLGQASVEQLVTELENANSWWRDTAHRLIFERQDRAAVVPLRRMLRRSDFALARLHALWALAGLDSLADEDLLLALRDSVPGVREHATRIAETRLTNPAVFDAILANAGDEDARVRFQVALTLGEVDDPRVVTALSLIAGRDQEDPWVRIALLSCLPSLSEKFLLRLLQDGQTEAAAPGRLLLRKAAEVVGARNKSHEIRTVLRAAARYQERRAIQLNVVLGIGQGLRRARANLQSYSSPLNTPEGRLVQESFARAGQLALASTTDLEQRLEAVQLLGYGGFEQAEPVLDQLLDGRQPLSLQKAAVAALAGYARPEVTGILLQKYSGLTPGTRQEVVDALLSRSERILPLLDAIAARKVSSALVPANRRSRLMDDADPTVRQRATQLFAADAPGPREDVIDQYQTALSLTADTAAGEKIYRRECLSCHRLGNQGYDVGPSLKTIRNRTPSELIMHVLDPNREVSPNFMEYALVTTDGRIVTGVIAEETATSVTLRRAENKQDTILRSEIDQLTSSGKSLMAEGLEKKVTPQELADLIGFLLGG